MRIVRKLQDLKTYFANPVVTIGNFDGIHLGHREIFRKVVRTAQNCRGTSVVLTFVPHPLKFIAPERAPRLINTYAEKERLIEASCIDVLICAPFDDDLAGYTASRFVDEILVGKIGVHHLVVGYDYAFGKGREGDVTFLRKKGEEHGFTVEVLNPISKGGEVYSSTRIRQLLAGGDVAGVVELLGRHFTLEGRVVHGAKRGKKIGFPTANLDTDKELLPQSGVYAVKVRRGEEVLDGVVNIGCKPTFRSEGISIEVHLLDFVDMIYGETLRLYFVDRLRDEMVFPDPAALTRAITADIAHGRQILENAQIIEYQDYLDCG